MKVCLLYSGWLRTYQQCQQNHKDALRAEEFTEVHINETNTEINYLQEQIFTFDDNKAPETKPQHTINQWRNNYLCFHAAPKDYDIYVRMRYDIHLIGGVDFETFEVNNNLCYIAAGHDYRDGINDMFAFGNYETMQKYYSVYLNYNKIYSDGHQFHTESYLKHNLINEGVEIKRLLIETKIIR